jgi:UDP-N-acetylenolpyruvoylglucosamine reductase
MATTQAQPMTPALTDEQVDQLKATVRGTTIQPGDEQYEAARHVYNSMIDRRPRAVVQTADVADVIAAVNFARENGAYPSVRAGAHNVTGFGTNDDGLVIDLSAMKSTYVDAKKQTARVMGGATWGDFDHATHAFGLATPGGILSTTGVSGLTLGGGIGYLTRQYGLSCDNVISADIVTADGRYVTASENENADLFWAIRGGGGNFGIVTSWEFKLHPVSMVYGGPIFFPVDSGPDVLAFYRDFILSAPPEVSGFFGYHVAPPAPFIPEHLHGHTACALVMCYTGPIEQAEAAMQPVRAAGPIALDLCGPIPYPALNSMFDALLPAGLQHYWKADFDRDLSDEAIAVHQEHGSQVPNFMSLMHLYPLNGAVQEMRSDETAFSYRDANFSHIIAGIDAEAANMPAHTSWVRNYWEALRPYSAGGNYVNFLMDEGQDRIKASYRDNYSRLAETKRKWDPDNLFRMNQNIKPA